MNLSKPREIEEEWISLDQLEIDNIDPHPNSLVLNQSNQEELVKRYHVVFLEALCPVTAQPDWATIYISYEGNGIKHKSLLRYLLSYRNHQGFHEECVERIFLDINKENVELKNFQLGQIF